MLGDQKNIKEPYVTVLSIETLGITNHPHIVFDHLSREDFLILLGMTQTTSQLVMSFEAIQT